MMVFYQNFIPFYSWIVSPLFKLLKKDANWDWGEREELAWVSSKQALCEAPVLAHPMEGKPYRLYTDASNIGGSAILQQIQPIKIRDLQGTKAYDLLRKSFDSGEVPKPLFKRLLDDENLPEPKLLTEPFEENEVYVERVISMYARTWNDAERKLSTTEKECLALKDGCIRHHPIIEGEDILAVTDHEALKWAVFGFDTKNRKLQSWNSVFSAFKLKVTHRPGKAHGNADYLSRFFPEQDPVLKTTLPSSVNPSMDNVGHIDLVEKERRAATDSFSPSLQVLLAQHRETSPLGGLRPIYREDAYLARQVVDTDESYATSARRSTRLSSRSSPSDSSPPTVPPADETPPDPDPQPTKDPPTSNVEGEPRARLDPELDHVEPSRSLPTMLHINVKLRDEILDAYGRDKFCQEILQDLDLADSNRVHPYYRDRQGLIYLDRKGSFCLLIPQEKRQEILELVHGSPFYAAHAGNPRTLYLLSRMFYWKKMAADCEDFVKSCDFCQKTKVDTRGLPGKMQFIDVPDRPGDALSMDYVVGLPEAEWNGQTYNSVLVVVDRFTRYAFYIPTTDRVTSVQTAQLLVDQVFTRLGFPLSIIADRDPKFTSAAFQAVAKSLGVKLNLSTSHHPQTDGMTEALNKSLELGLRAFVAQDQKDWPQYLPALSFAHNSMKHGSTTMTPFELLMAYHPRGPEGDLRSGAPDVYRSAEAEDFKEQFEARREIARSSMMVAQAHQAKYYNQRRRPEVFHSNDKVLVNAKTSMLKPEAKLNERWLGPFEILEVVSPVAYRLRLGREYSKVHNVFSIAHLKKYHDPQRGWTPRPPMEPSRPDHSHEEWEAEEIVEHEYRKKYNRKTRSYDYAPWYLVKYVGYPVAEWTEAANVANSPRLLREYRRTPKHQEVEDRESRRKDAIRKQEKARSLRNKERKKKEKEEAASRRVTRSSNAAERFPNGEKPSAPPDLLSPSSPTITSYHVVLTDMTAPAPLFPMEVDPRAAAVSSPSPSAASTSSSQVHVPSSVPPSAVANSSALTVLTTTKGTVSKGVPVAAPLDPNPAGTGVEVSYPVTVSYFQGSAETLDAACEAAYWRGLDSTGPIALPSYWGAVAQQLNPAKPSFVELQKELLHLIAGDAPSPGFVQSSAFPSPLIRAMTSVHCVFLDDLPRLLRPIESSQCAFGDLALEALAQAHNGVWRVMAQGLDELRNEIADRQVGPSVHNPVDGEWARPSRDVTNQLQQLGEQLEQFLRFTSARKLVQFSASGHPPVPPYAPLLQARSTYVVHGMRSRSLDLVYREHIGSLLFLLAEVGLMQMHLSGAAKLGVKSTVYGAPAFNQDFLVDLIEAPDAPVLRLDHVSSSFEQGYLSALQKLRDPRYGNVFRAGPEWTSHTPKHDVASNRNACVVNGRTPAIPSGREESLTSRGTAAVSGPATKRLRTN